MIFGELAKLHRIVGVSSSSTSSEHVRYQSRSNTSAGLCSNRVWCTQGDYIEHILMGNRSETTKVLFLLLIKNKKQ